MKEKINAFDYSKTILEKLPKGVLLTTKYNNKVNTMVIGWASIGIEWRKQIFIAYVRDSRYTKELIDKTNEFTINIPIEDIDPNILKIAGTKSGREIDKIKELNLTLEEPTTINTPSIKELPLTLECKVLYKVRQEDLDENIKNMFYPINDKLNTKEKRDLHTIYYGEIVDSYIIK